MTVSRQKSSICVHMWNNLADILQKLAAKKLVKSRLLCVARGNWRENWTVCFSSIYIRDLNLAPIRFVQLVPRFFPRCPLYSFIISISMMLHVYAQPRSQGLCGETVTKTLLKFVLSFQKFGKKIACAVRHNRIQLYCNHWLQLIAIRLCRTAHAIFFPKFWNDKMNFTRVFVIWSSSPSHREGPGTEVGLRHWSTQGFHFEGFFPFLRKFCNCKEKKGNTK